MTSSRSVDSGTRFLNYLVKKELRKLKAGQQRKGDTSPSLMQQGGAKKKRSKAQWMAFKKMLAAKAAKGGRKKKGGKKAGRKKKGGKKAGRRAKGRKAGRRAKGRKAGRKAGRRKKRGGRKVRRGGKGRRRAGAKKHRRRKNVTSGVYNAKPVQLPTTALLAGQKRNQTGAMQNGMRAESSRQFSLQKRSGLQPMTSLQMYRERL